MILSHGRPREIPFSSYTSGDTMMLEREDTKMLTSCRFVWLLAIFLILSSTPLYASIGGSRCSVSVAPIANGIHRCCYHTQRRQSGDHFHVDRLEVDAGQQVPYSLLFHQDDQAIRLCGKTRSNSCRHGLLRPHGDRRGDWWWRTHQRRPLDYY